jgi:hypothetical protein
VEIDELLKLLFSTHSPQKCPIGKIIKKKDGEYGREDGVKIQIEMKS